MICERYNIWEDGEYTYPAAFGFEPNIRTYIHEDARIRPAVLVVPGGGYRVVSPTEGEIVAKKFYEMGYQTFVCTYTTNLLGLADLKEQPMRDLSRAIRFIRKYAEIFHINVDKLVLCGFSAGAHLCGSVTVHWMDLDDVNERYSGISNKPNGAILSYPVITSGEYAHKDSFISLYGSDPTAEELEYASLEKQVTADTPPMFLWQTVTDQTVPVENSMRMVKALKENNVSFAYHLFPQGQHGLSLSNDDWENARLGEPYTMEQTFGTLQAVKDGVIPMEEEAKLQLFAAFAYLDPDAAKDPAATKPGVAEKDVAIWPELAKTWMDKI